MGKEIADHLKVARKQGLLVEDTKRGKRVTNPSDGRSDMVYPSGKGYRALPNALSALRGVGYKDPTRQAKNAGKTEEQEPDDQKPTGQPTVANSEEEHMSGVDAAGEKRGVVETILAEDELAINVWSVCERVRELARKDGGQTKRHKIDGVYEDGLLWRGRLDDVFYYLWPELREVDDRDREKVKIHMATCLNKEGLVVLDFKVNGGALCWVRDNPPKTPAKEQPVPEQKSAPRAERPAENQSAPTMQGYPCGKCCYIGARERSLISHKGKCEANSGKQDPGAPFKCREISRSNCPGEMPTVLSLSSHLRKEHPGLMKGMQLCGLTNCLKILPVGRASLVQHNTAVHGRSLGPHTKNPAAPATAPVPAPRAESRVITGEPIPAPASPPSAVSGKLDPDAAADAVKRLVTEGLAAIHENAELRKQLADATRKLEAVQEEHGADQRTIGELRTRVAQLESKKGASVEEVEALKAKAMALEKELAALSQIKAGMELLMGGGK